MQISRHWRMNSQRYRLEGMRFQNGEVCLQTRPAPAVEIVRTAPRPAASNREHAMVAGR
ncbi:MAG: hypothetical protein DIU68_013405 [Chloroflexota bacterium]